MLDVLSNRTYRHLFFAQVIALLGTGLATVALGLLAFDLAGANAGAVLGTALAIKMVAYIGVAPVASALAERLPRRAVLVALDLVRAFVALMLPFVTQIWQVYLLIFVLQSASAAFTPTFQATIPDVLPDEDQYTKALSLSRLAYDLESLVSPMLAALLLSFVSYHSLFGGTVVGFIASAVLVVSRSRPLYRLNVPLLFTVWIPLLMYPWMEAHSVREKVTPLSTVMASKSGLLKANSLTVRPFRQSTVPSAGRHVSLSDSVTLVVR